MRYRFFLWMLIAGWLIMAGFAVFPAAASSAEPVPADKPVFIGVLAHRGASNCIKRWQPLADDLGERIPGHSFQIVQLAFEQIETAMVEQLVDFMLVNPVIYVELELRFGACRILTLEQIQGGHLVKEFAAVLFHRADQPTDGRLRALRGNSLAAVDPNSLAWLALRREMQDSGLDYDRDLTALSFYGSHDQVVYEVLAGRSRFGVVRTGVLERMAQEGLITPADLVVLHEHGGGNVHLPFAHSTRAYPEWPLARLAHTSDQLAKQVAAVLLQMSAAGSTAQACDIGGWVNPLQYKPVRELLMSLKLPPYEHLGEVTLGQIWDQYYRFIILFLLMLGLILFGFTVLSAYNRRISKLRQAQEENIKELQAAREKVRNEAYISQELLNAVPMPLFFISRERRFMGCNLAFEEFAGVTRKSMRGLAGLDFKLFEHQPLLEKGDFQLFLKGGDVVRELVLEDAAGKERIVELRLTVYRYRDRRPAGLIGLINDMTEHKFLLRRMIQLGAVIEQASETIVITDPQGKIQYVNPAFEKTTGYKFTEVFGHNPRILKSGRQDQAFYSDLWRTVKRGESWQGQFVNRRKDGTFYDEEAAIFPVRNQDGQIISLAAVKRDVTQLKAMQLQLRTSQRLEAVGQLAAGVAHELNTPVGFVASNFESIINYIDAFVKLIEFYRQLLREQAETLGQVEGEALRQRAADLEDDLQIEFILEDLNELFSDSRDGFERITSIVSKLREFSRVDQLDEKESFNFNRAIETTVVVARNEYKYCAEVELDLAEDLPDTLAQGGEINQVLLNLIVNAAQAIKEQEREGPGAIKLSTSYDDDFVYCRVSDDGPGIEPDNLEKIFDPFFTTKPVGKGTGLGLNISYDIIVNKHHGQLKVDSTLGEGTSFTLALPRPK